MDWDIVDERPNYRVCQTGFALIALALGLLCIDAVLDLTTWFTGNQAIRMVLSDPLWTWLVGAPITWGSLLGSYLLLGRWPEPSWRRRVGLLVLMNTADAGFWILNHGDALGLRLGPMPHPWARMHLGMAMGWAELALIATLAADVSVRAGDGQTQAVEASRAARSCALFGAMLWAIWFLTQTRWNHWPLVAQRLSLEGVLLMLASVLLLALTAFQVTILCIMASRQCGRMIRDLNQADQEHDLLRSRSEIAWQDPSYDDPWTAPRSDPWG
jgi:hypothetical protein